MGKQKTEDTFTAAELEALADELAAEQMDEVEIALDELADCDVGALEAIGYQLNREREQHAIVGCGGPAACESCKARYHLADLVFSVALFAPDKQTGLGSPTEPRKRRGPKT